MNSDSYHAEYRVRCLDYQNVLDAEVSLLEKCLKGLLIAAGPVAELLATA